MGNQYQKLLRLMGISSNTFLHTDDSTVVSSVKDSLIKVTFTESHGADSMTENVLKKEFKYVQLHYLFALISTYEFKVENKVEYIHCEEDSFTVAMIINERLVVARFHIPIAIASLSEK